MSATDQSAFRALAHLHDVERQSQGDPSERRVFKRFPVRGLVRLRPAARHAKTDHTVEAHLRDVGRGGMAFVCSEPLPDQSLWTASFMQHGCVVAEQTIQIRHKRVVDDGCHLHGIQFVASDGLMALLGVNPTDIDHTLGDEDDNVSTAGHFTTPEAA